MSTRHFTRPIEKVRDRSDPTQVGWNWRKTHPEVGAVERGESIADFNRRRREAAEAARVARNARRSIARAGKGK